MLGFLQYILINYVFTDIDALPSHDFYQLLTSEHIETFHAAFSSSLNSQADSDHSSLSSSAHSRHSSKHDIQHIEHAVPEIQQQRPPPVKTIQPFIETTVDSPAKSDEGYGSFVDETVDEIAALGIIEEGDELPDYGVSMLPSSYSSLSPIRRNRRDSSSSQAMALSPGLTPTKQKLAQLKPQITQQNASKMSQDARNVLAMGYTLSLLGEKFDKARSIEGSVKSVIIKAGQAIERGSQAGSVYGKSRYAGSRYGGSRYGGSKFGGSKVSVAKSVRLDETLPSWGF